MKYIITGGPCSGKTTLLNALKNEGFDTIPEAARMVMLEGRFHPKHNGTSFQREVALRQRQLESLAETDVFIDRGIPDGLAYCKVQGYPPPPELERLARTAQYDKVFLLERLPWKNDEQRWEDEETQTRLHQAIRDAYEQLGHKPVTVPVLPVGLRLRTVLQEVSREQSG